MEKPSRDADIRAWIRGYMEGDARAGELLAGHVLATVRRRIKGYGVPANDVDDLAQSCALEVLRHASEFDPTRGRLDSWVGGFAFNTVRQYRRQARLGQAVRHRDDFVARAKVSAPLTLALTCLDENEKRLVRMRFVLRMTSPEIATDLNQTPDATRKQISRILEKLRKHPSIHQLLR